MIKAVLFDLDETLLDRTGSLAAFLGDQHRRFRRDLGDPPFPAWLERFLALDARGSVSKLLVYSTVLSEFGGDISAAPALLADYAESCCRHARPFGQMHEVLAALRSRGKRIAVVTNGQTDFQTRHIEALGLGDLVDQVLISEAEGLRKPDRRIFHRAADRLGVPRCDCLFVGDNPSADILGAHDAGLQTVWFRCGQTWPANLGPNPAPTIERLPEVLQFVD